MYSKNLIAFEPIQFKPKRFSTDAASHKGKLMELAAVSKRGDEKTNMEVRSESISSFPQT